MPTYRDDAIVLRTHLLGESDKIVTLLGRSRGKIRAVAKGIRKTTSRFGARLEPFNQVDAMFYVGKSLDIIQQAESLGSHSQAIGKDYGKYTCAMVMVETADKLTDHDYQPAHYSLLLGGLRALAAGDHDSSLIVDSYLLRALALAGGHQASIPVRSPVMPGTTVCLRGSGGSGLRRGGTAGFPALARGL
jgi:DNA repair protein RecO